MIDFGREICGNLSVARRREWLVTNGIGGYASGTVAGMLTRRYHGLLIAALQPPLGRTLMLTKFDETALYDGISYPLFTNQWSPDEIEPDGNHYLQRFHLEGTVPIWTFALGDALLEKRIWMEYGLNKTCIRYILRRASLPLHLEVKAIANFRDSHANTHTGSQGMQVEVIKGGLCVTAFDGAAPLYLVSDGAQVAPDGVWYRDYYLAVEDYRGLDPLDDNYHIGMFEAELHPGESLTFAASAEPFESIEGVQAYIVRQAQEQLLVAQAHVENEPDWIKQVVLAADQFIVRRALPDHPDGKTVIAGYPWFSDWGRDIMIALPGLTLSTGRYADAANILRTFAHFVDQGMLPNRFPDVGETPEYNTVDATLWYFEAIRACHAATGDDDLLHDLFPLLQDIIDWHIKGTRYSIHVDPTDGLLLRGSSRCAAHMDGCQDWRLGGDAAHRQSHRDQRLMVQCAANDGAFFTKFQSISCRL